jgi:hypothetical protein
LVVSYSTWLVAIVRILLASRRPWASEALATSSYDTYFVPHPLSADTFVRAAVNVVFPWSTCPIVPTFTWGFVRSNLALAMVQCSLGSQPFCFEMIASAMVFGTSS